MENKIVIAATLQFEQDYNLRLSKFENFCVKKIENEINNTGGIGGLKIAINTRFISKKEFEIRGIPEFAKKREQCYQEMKPDIILDVGPQTFQYAPNFFETFKGLVFSNIDPSLNFKHPRFFEMSDELLDNRGSVSFFAKQLLPPAILLVQQSYIATEKTLKAYENSLKTCGWKGNFVSFSLQEEEEQALPEQALPDGTSDQEERIIL